MNNNKSCLTKNKLVFNDFIVRNKLIIIYFN